jgi:acetyl-CoA C-acetyltransferase
LFHIFNLQGKGITDMTYLPIAIRGFGQTSFGELWNISLSELLKQATESALSDSNISPDEIDAIFVSNMASGNYEYQMHLNSLVSSFFPHHPPAFRLESACASGGLAVVSATHALQSGAYKNVLVVGAEKMTDLGTDQSTKILAGASDTITEYGSTFPGLYALLAELYKSKYQISSDSLRLALSLISSRAHDSALTNQYAQFRKNISPDSVTTSPLVADPLRVLDCSPLSDGAAALVLSLDRDRKIYPQLPHIIGSGHAQDSLDLASRKDLPHLTATSKAASLAFGTTKLTPHEISIIELHDCFTIAEILAIEDLGFLAKGTAVTTLIKKGEYRAGLTINPSGGLKACGHPVGATGIKQIGVVSNYLQNSAKSKQYGLTQNVGGTGGTVIVHIIERNNL